LDTLRLEEDNDMLNSKKKKRPVDPDHVEQEPVEEGTYPCRVVEIIELGLQPQAPHKNQAKPPVERMQLTYELTDEFCLDKEGEEDEALPRWQREDFPYYGTDCTTATCNKRLKAIDPKNTKDGNWAEVASMACNVTFFHKVKGDKTYVNVSAATAIRPKDLEDVAPLKHDVKIFDIDDPDLGVFYKLPKWLQNKITGNLNFEGSVLEEAIENYEPEKEEDKEPPKQKKKPTTKKKKNRKAPPVEDKPEKDEDGNPIEYDEDGNEIPW
jgi:hypothetical protein